MLFMYLEYIPSQKPSRNIVDLNAYILKPDQEAEATVQLANLTHWARYIWEVFSRALLLNIHEM